MQTYWAVELQMHRAALALQARHRGNRIRLAVQAAREKEREQMERAPAAADTRQARAARENLAKLRAHVRRRDLQAEAERAVFQLLYAAVNAAGHSPDELERVIRSNPLQVVELPQAVVALMRWLCGLTQGMSLYIMGRIIARRREPELQPGMRDGGTARDGVGMARSTGRAVSTNSASNLW